jgi:LPXTG-site transpeptidase (sortase) family protein
MSKEEVVVKHRKSINVLFRTIGNTLIILAVFFLGLGFWPYAESELKYNWEQLVGQRYFLVGDNANAIKQADKSVFGAILAAPPPISITPVNTDFAIVIPKINVNTVVAQDVNAADYNEYTAALKKGAAHALGTVYPGQDGNSYVFAHSTLNFWEIGRYNAVFTLLRKLEPGDLIVTFYQGQRHDYTVTEKLVLEANDIRYITPKADGRQLTLQTCDPPGTTLRRLIIVAKMR